MSRKNLARHIRQLRMEHSWSQAQLAEISNLSLRTVQRVERDGICSPESLLSLAAAFEIDVKEFTRFVLEDNHKTTFFKKVFEQAQRLEEIIMMLSKQGLLIIGSGIFYILFLFAMVALTANLFHQFYNVMPSAKEFELNAPYRQFLAVLGISLAVYVGVWSAFFGVWRKKIWQGLVALFTGIAITISALELLPWIQFPYDQYPASAGWLMGNIFIIAITWLIITTIGKIFAKRGMA